MPEKFTFFEGTFLCHGISIYIRFSLHDDGGQNNCNNNKISTEYLEKKKL